MLPRLLLLVLLFYSLSLDLSLHGDTFEYDNNNSDLFVRKSLLQFLPFQPLSLVATVPQLMIGRPLWTICSSAITASRRGPLDPFAQWQWWR